ncbi:hypothetical protein Glove_137g88 [Diversispora epigaea]|uniref:Uncharacterized protein n=1 Tax=Diversispora epigaea TaxID=1348612 RepID=A0A397J627_9GLOM|nr:hypothetical protein Glove_137g88 [Diversispora epigaea]
MEAIKMDKEVPFSSDQIKNNIYKLKNKLGKVSTSLYRHLYFTVDDISIHNLTWEDSLASQVISDKLELVKQLSTNLKKAFKKLA